MDEKNAYKVIVRQFLDILTAYKHILLTNSANLEQLINLCKVWETQLMNLKKYDFNDYTLQRFRDVFYTELRAFIFFLREQQNDVLRGFHDRVFTNIFKFNIKLPNGITIVFEEFVKGITYFSDEQDNFSYIPIYHRLTSCGVGNDAFRALYHTCTPQMDAETKKQIQKRISTCYIERLIYDKLYTAYTTNNLQDEGHEHRLDITKADFKTCFPSIDFSIDIQYDQHMPVRLVVNVFQHENLIATEFYTKSIIHDTNSPDIKKYSAVVECYCTTYQATKYIKYQAFEVKNKWKETDVEYPQIPFSSVLY